MRCPACQTDNPASNRFCDQCGTALEARCPECQAPLRPGARFCGACGHRLAAVPEAPAEAPRPSAPAPAALSQERESRLRAYTPKHLADKVLKARSALEGERRVVTVLFADVAGFTSLAEKLDPEEVHRVIEGCFEAITAEVHRFEGTVNQYTGDGAMALFGAPIAHEDGPRRAVHAALGIQRAIRDLSRELQAGKGLSLQMRMGINTGPVVVGKIGDDLRMDYTAVGDTTNLAARLQQAARPGSVVVSEATHKVVGPYFETLDLGELALKGHAPVRAWEVLRPRARRSRLDAVAGWQLTPLVGREREVETLLGRFGEAKAGRGQAVFVAGEAGIGKSRLLLEFRQALVQAEEQVTWLEGQCVSFGQGIPFLPLVDQLRQNFGIEEFDGEPEIIAKVEHGMRRMGELDSHIPYVRYLLGVDPGDPAVAGMDARVRRQKAFDAVRALGLRGCRIRPIVFVFEDLHWIDKSTEEYIGYLMDALASLPILAVLTYRVGYAPPFGTRSFFTTLTLRSLSEAETLAMAGRVLRTERFPPELRTALMEKAEGVPLFIEEVTKTLLDLGVLRPENGGYRMVKTFQEVGVPETIQGIIMARLDRLGEEGKRTVQLASVIGRQFLRRLLERIAGLTEDLEGLLRELKQLEIIYEQGLLPEPAYVFKHAVIQDVAYQSLLRERRKELHRAVGRAIEELYADRLADHLEELAHHFTRGEEWARAFDYLVRSGDKARDAYANQAALDHYARALEVAPRGAPPVAPPGIKVVHQRRSRIWILLSRHAEAIGDAEKMVEVARAAGDRRAEGEALADLAHAHFTTLSGEHMASFKKVAKEAFAIARETGDERVMARSLTELGTVDQFEGRLPEGEEKLKQAIRLADRAGFKDANPLLMLTAGANWRGRFREAIGLARDTERLAVELHDDFSESLGLAFRCIAHAALGEHAEAIAVIEEGLRKARERQSLFNIGRLTNSLGWLHQELGDFRRALELDTEATDLGKRSNPNVEISSLINLAYDYLHLGEPRRALPVLEETLGKAEKGFGAHRWRWTMHCHAYLAEALLADGRGEQALPHIDKAAALARETGSMKYVARAHALGGEAALAAREWRRGEADLAEALGICREIGYATGIWQAAHSLSRARAAQRKVEEAFAAARLAAETIDRIAERVPDPALRRTFLGWSRVQAVRDDLDRLRRG
jgi:class 3 adenylate cyclase/tetratricopeptide (TPR) repeat protein